MKSPCNGKLTVFLILVSGFFLFAQNLRAEITTFAAIGDYGEDNAANTNVSAMVDGWQPEFIITLGDNRQDNVAYDNAVGSRYCNYLADINGGVNCPSGTSPVNAFFPSIGNHEYDDGAGIDDYLNYFLLPGNNVPGSSSSGNERYYDFIRGPVHFFVINSDSREPDGTGSNSIQAQWLQAQISASPASWQVVYFHHSPFTSGIRVDAGLRWPYATWGADALIYGHNHFYERMEVDGIPYFQNGAGGSDLETVTGPFIPESRAIYFDDYGAMRVFANEIGMTFEFVSLDDGATGGNGGLLVDSFSIGEAPVLLSEDFNSGDGSADAVLPDWSVVDEGIVQGPSNWNVSGGQLQQSSDISGTNTDPGDLSKPGTYL